MPDDAAEAARSLLEVCRGKKLTVATAESCTGGLVAAALTAIAGSSDVFDRGFVTYTNDAKQAMLGVPDDTLSRFGAVSEETARAMAEGALANAPADLVVSITGIAGPGGGSPQKPVGLVHFDAAARSGKTLHQRVEFGDIGREAVRARAVLKALALLRELAEGEKPRA
jgi:nicotinamide-nucleotide amidase